jgi:hypothetical protein
MAVSLSTPSTSLIAYTPQGPEMLGSTPHHTQTQQWPSDGPSDLLGLPNWALPLRAVHTPPTRNGAS